MLDDESLGATASSRLASCTGGGEPSVPASEAFQEEEPEVAESALDLEEAGVKGGRAVLEADDLESESEPSSSRDEVSPEHISPQEVAARTALSEDRKLILDRFLADAGRAVFPKVWSEDDGSTAASIPTK